MGFRADMRAAAVTLLEGYKAANPAAGLRQIYPGRPRSLNPGVAFPDGFTEASITYTAGPRNRNPVLEVILVRAIYDSEEAVTLQDDFVDDFMDYVTANPDAAGANSLLTFAGYVDEPNYQPDWIANAPFYYATRVRLEGVISEGGLI